MADTDKLGEVRFPIKASVVVGAGVLLLSFFYWASTKSTPLTILFFAGSIAAAGALLTAFYTARSLALNAAFLEREERRHKIDLALQRAARWNDPAMYYIRDTVRELFDTDHKSEQFQKSLGSKRTNVIHFLNFLEEVAIVIDKGGADEEILKDAFHGIVVTACSKLESWMANERITRGRPKIWIKMQELGKKWN